MKYKKLNLEVKAVNDDGFFSGYASVFDVVDSYGDIVRKGAFLRSIDEFKTKGKMPPVLWQHRSDMPIGVYTEMKEDDKGLYVEGNLLINDVPQAKATHALLKAGAVSGLSIGYRINDGKWGENDHYELLDLKLFEVSVVTFPANEESLVDTVKAKINHGELPTLPEFEKFLRDAGFSKKQATAIASRGLRPLLGEPTEKAKAISETLNILKSINNH
ncbi:MAG: HK97 family phage prohead protease [Gammaproteobacteria bacterium]|nr:HK97 family phage prohead protease [Gammaproteobacteria bacterium]